MAVCGMRRYINWLRSRFLYPAVTAFLLITVIIPASVYFLSYDMADESTEDISTCVIQEDYRVPCGFFAGREMGNITSYNCREMGCCFDDFTKTCFHYFPAKYGYKKEAEDSPFYSAKKAFTPLGNRMHEFLKMSIISNKYFIQASLEQADNPMEPRTKYRNRINLPKEIYEGISYNMSEKTLEFEIYRNNNPDEKLLQTSRGPIIASDGYWEMTVQLTNRNDTMYGLGGLHINGITRKVIYRNEADHSNIPFFLAQQETPDGIQYHALLVQHKGVLEVEVLESNLIILRALNTSSNGLSLRLYPGPTLDKIKQQIALNPNQKPTENIPRWLLGTHICRNNVTDLETMLLEFVYEQQFNVFEADSDCFNELLMILLIEMYDDLKPEARNLFRDSFETNLKTKFVLPLTPHIPIGIAATDKNPLKKYHLFNKAFEMNVLLKNSTKHIMRGVYKNRDVAFLNPHAERAGEYLKILLDIINEYVIDLEKIDGVFLLDNWPQDDSFNFTARSKLLYHNEEIISAVDKTQSLLISDQEQFVKRQIELVREAFDREIPILSASHYYQLDTALFPQHVNKSWANLKSTTTRTIFANVFTHPVALNPLCGTDPWMNATTQENELCARWFLNQATLPGQRMTMNWYAHSNLTLSSRNAIDKAMELKRMLSYYQYTVLRETAQAVKPMFMDFPSDNETWALDEQYMLGDLLIVPIFLPQITMRRLYLPENVTWFEFWGGMHFDSGWQNLSVSSDERFLFLRESSLVPVLNTKVRNDQYFDLVVAKSCKMGRQSVQGSIIFDNHVLKMDVTDRFVEFSNIKNVQTEINCDLGTKKHPHTVKTLKFYECGSEENEEKIKIVKLQIDFDLCKLENQDLEKVLFTDPNNL